MAHVLTRLEGFESGTFISLNGDVNTLGSVQATFKRSGDYACRVTNDGVSTASIVMSNAFDGVGKPSTTQLFAAAAYRVWLFIIAYPDANGRVVMQIENHVGTGRSIFTMSTTGVLTLDGTAGSTALALSTWYEIAILYDSAASGTVNVLIDRVQEFTNVVPTSNGTVGRLRVGKTVGTGSHDLVVDDIVIEAAAAVASIDYPLPGSILAMDPEGDGMFDGAFAAVGAAQAWQCVGHPHDGDTTNIAVSNSGVRRQTFLLESPATVGITSIINGAQFCQVARKETAEAVDVRILAAPTDTAVIGELLELTSTDIPTGTTYNFYASVEQLSPFTSLAWTLAELGAMVNGTYGAPSASPTAVLRVSTAFVMVDSQAQAGALVNSTFLSQSELVTGSLRSITNYSPEIRTVRITSEAMDLPNEAFNVIACSIRHVPSGVGVIRGVWFFDQLATSNFTLADNPLRDELLHAGANSSFTFSDSEMVDGYQVYTEYLPIEGSGKIFELALIQTGSRDLEVLAIDFDIKPEGRREAYLEGRF